MVMKRIRALCLSKHNAPIKPICELASVFGLHLFFYRKASDLLKRLATERRSLIRPLAARKAETTSGSKLFPDSPPTYSHAASKGIAFLYGLSERSASKTSATAVMRAP